MTLYDLLGALPHDDAEALRSAFRRAVKGAHPDLRPGDPDAALKFREIARANEILGDVEQRAAYDHLLELARLEQEQASKYAVAARIHKLASGVIAFAGASIVTVGGYLLFMHMSAASVAPANDIDAAMRTPTEIASVSPAGPPEPTGESPPAKRGSTSIPGGATAPGAAVPQSNAASVAVAKAGPAPDPAAREAGSFPARGISAGRSGELHAFIAGLDLQPVPNSSPAYIDRGVVFYRQRKLNHTFPDIVPAKGSEKPGHAKSASAMARKPRFDRPAIAPSVTSIFRRRTAAQDPSRLETVASARTR